MFLGLQQSTHTVVNRSPIWSAECLAWRDGFTVWSTRAHLDCVGGELGLSLPDIAIEPPSGFRDLARALGRFRISIRDHSVVGARVWAWWDNCESSKKGRGSFIISLAWRAIFFWHPCALPLHVSICGGLPLHAPFSWLLRAWALVLWRLFERRIAENVWCSNNYCDV